MRKGRLRELLRRQLLQILGLYLAAGWGIIEFTDWATGHFGISFALTDLVVTVWLLSLPLVVFLGWIRAGGTEPSTEGPREHVLADKSVAVLPFANLSDSPENDYLSDGISEEIINSLSRVEGLRVVSRTSVFTYKGKNEDVRTIGRQLNVATVLEGGVRLSGSNLRITTRLIDVADGYLLWSERFDREMEDVFAIEDEIAENVVRSLQVILRDEERRRLSRIPTVDVKAYEYYLRGRQYFHQTRRKSLEYAREMFTRATEIDPDYALAYAGIANASALNHMYYPSSRGDLETADENSRKALELDPDLADAHAARGLVLFQQEQFGRAQDEFRKAIRLDPYQFEARYFFARACFQQGRLEEAADLFDEAFSVREDYQAAFFAAQSREALGQRERASAGYARALDVAEKHMDLNPDDPRAATMRAVALCRLGRMEEGVHWAERALSIDPNDAGVRYNVACLYALEGLADKAIECLEEAVRVGFGHHDWIEHDPDLDSLRGDPRFQALLAGR